MNRAFTFVLVSLLLSACTVRVLTLDDLEGDHFADIQSFASDVLTCRGNHVMVFDLGPTAATEDIARAIANEVIRGTDIETVADAGGVWLLFGANTELIGAVGKAPATVTYCEN